MPVANYHRADPEYLGVESQIDEVRLKAMMRGLILQFISFAVLFVINVVRLIIGDPIPSVLLLASLVASSATLGGVVANLVIRP